MNEYIEVKIRREFQQEYGYRLDQIEAIAQSHGYPPFIGQPIIEWILELIHRENRSSKD